MHIATRVDRFLMKLTGGHLRLSFVIPVLLLFCRGAKTNKVREVPLLFVPNGDMPLLIGSNAGGAKDPNWCHNLRAHPNVSCIISGKKEEFRAQELVGEERRDAWKLAVEIYPGYSSYERRLRRLIPIFKLFPL